MRILAMTLLSFLIVSGSVFAALQETPGTLRTHDGQTLETRLALPEGPIRAVAVILPGSGNVNFEGDVSGPFTGFGYRGAPAKLNNQLAEAAAASGIATLRYTKRGYSADPTKAVGADISDLTKDTLSAIRELRRSYPSTKLALIGFSEGALLAMLAAAETNVDALYLLGLPTRPIDEVLHYQFVGWPVELIRSRLDKNHDDILSKEELQMLPSGEFLPLMGPPLGSVPVEAMDANHDGQLSITGEVIPFYKAFYISLRPILETPALAAWYRSLKALPPFERIAEKVTAPLHVYQGLNDAQVDWKATMADLATRENTSFELFAGAGHCFSPMDGAIGQVKTSGPLSDELIEMLRRDLSRGF